VGFDVLVMMVLFTGIKYPEADLSLGTSSSASGLGNHDKFRFHTSLKMAGKSHKRFDILSTHLAQ